MKDLFGRKKEDPVWLLDEFVDMVNTYLPQYLPTETSDARVTDKINSRLIRYYTTQGMLNEPEKTGRNAQYTYRHLLQVIVVRRLLAEGYASGVIGRLVTSKTTEEMEALLQGGVQLTVSVANPALAYLYEIQGKTGAPPTVPGSKSNVPASLDPLRETSWTRIEILPGCEMHISDRFVAPKSVHEEDYITKTIFRILKKFKS
jgi:DNA-binding transcriptional MerR regulator